MAQPSNTQGEPDFASMQSRRLMQLPGMLAGVLVWLILFGTAFAPSRGRFGFFGWHMGWRVFGSDKVTPLVGFGLMVLGVILFIWTVVIFSDQKETIHPDDPTKSFAIKGPYRYATHPMFAGVFAMQLGTACLFGSGALLVYFGLFALFVVTPIVIAEQRRLGRLYGAAYRRYLRRVTFFPWRALVHRPYPEQILRPVEPVTEA